MRTTRSIEDVVRTALATALDAGVAPGDIDADADFVERYGLDSLRAIAFLVSLEDTLDVELDPGVLDGPELRTVAALSAHLATIR